jgi:hypothetical protein
MKEDYAFPLIEIDRSLDLLSTGKIQSGYSTVVLSYNVSTPVYFVSSQMIIGAVQFSPQWSAYYGTAAVNLALIGTIGSDPFGQNIPFVSVYINS